MDIRNIVFRSSFILWVQQYHSIVSAYLSFTRETWNLEGFSRPHLGSGRVVQKGQKIHFTLFKARDNGYKTRAETDHNNLPANVDNSPVTPSEKYKEMWVQRDFYDDVCTLVKFFHDPIVRESTDLEELVKKTLVYLYQTGESVVVTVMRMCDKVHIQNLAEQHFASTPT